MRTSLVKIIATGLGFGYLKPFAGTWGTIPGIVLCYFIYPLGIIYQAGTIVLLFIISVWASGRGENYFGHDNKKIVIDEILGASVTLFLIPNPRAWQYYLLGFVLFRIFDVAKLEPAKASEKLAGGWGVTMDDFIAAIYANITLQLLARFIIKV